MGLTSLSPSLTHSPSHFAGKKHAANDFILLEVYDKKASDPSKRIYTVRASFNLTSMKLQDRGTDNDNKEFLDTVRAAFPYDDTQTGKAKGSRFTSIAFKQTSEDGKEWEQSVKSVNINTRFSFKAPAGVQSVE